MKRLLLPPALVEQALRHVFTYAKFPTICFEQTLTSQDDSGL